MKRKIVLVLILTLFLSSLTAFAELEINLNGHWVEKAINKEFIKLHFDYLIKEDTITFNPEDRIDKSIFMYSLYSIIEGPVQEKSVEEIKQLDINSIIRRLKEKKIAEDNIILEGKISRKDMVKYILKTLELSNEMQISDLNYLPYRDIQELDDEYKKYILKANMIGIIKGYGDSTFRPEENTSIAEAIIMLQRLKEELGILKNNIPFKVIESSTAYSGRKPGVTVKSEKNRFLVTIIKEFPASGYSFIIDKVEKIDQGKYGIYLKVIGPSSDAITQQVINYQETTIEIDKSLIDSRSYEFEIKDAYVQPKNSTENKSLM